MRYAPFLSLQIIILIELGGMRDLGQLGALGSLVLDEVLQKLLGEHTAHGQVVVVGLQGIQSLGEAGGKTLELGLLLVGEVVEVEVVGTPALGVRIDLVLDAVQSRHEDGGVAEVGVTGSVGVTEFKAALVGALGVGGDTDDRGAVGGGVAHGDGSLKAGDEALEGVGGGVGQSAEGGDVLEQTAHEVVGRLGQVGVAVVIREHRLTVLEEDHVDVHTAACLAVDGLGHEGGGLAVLQGGVVDDILDLHGGIGHVDDLTQLRLDLELTRRGHLGVVVVDLDAHVLHEHAHLAAALIGDIEGLGDMVILLLGDHHAEALGGAVPVGLLGIHGSRDLTAADLPAHVVEEVELELGEDLHLVGHAAVLHVLHGRADDVAGVLGQGAVLGGVDDHGVTRHGQGGNGAEGVDHGCVGVGNEDHVALLHHGVPVVGGVEADAASHGVLGEVFGGNGDVTVLAVDIHHFEIHHLDALLLDESQDVLYALCHCFVPLS